jgi:Mg-chelatase subunit ChlD
MPLTSDSAAVQTRLSEMSPVGNTNIPLGVEFGWNLLDPAAPFTEGASYTDPNTKKFLVLLTDGVQTSGQWDKKGTRSKENGEDNLVTLCNNIGKKDVTIFAIAYDITDKKVTKLLEKCADKNYFEATSGGSELDTVFSAITERVKKSLLRLTQ